MVNNNHPLCLIDSRLGLNFEQIKPLQKNFKIIYYDQYTNFDKNSVEVLLTHSKVNPEFINQCKQLKWIGIRAKHTDYINTNLIHKKDIQIFGIPSLGSTAVSEHVFALLFALSKKIILNHQAVTSGVWQNEIIPHSELSEKKLGILGFGEIGQNVAKKAEAFGMRPLVAQSPFKYIPNAIPLDEVLENSDIISLHLPFREENRNFINKTRLFQMKKGALIINTSRGTILEESALIEALSCGHLGGAGLDVFESEPPKNSTLLQCKNIVFSPHVAYYTHETLEKMNKALVDTFLREYQKFK